MNKKEKKYYIEPVEIEIYLKKAGIVRTIIKDLKIELVEVIPPHEKAARYLNSSHHWMNLLT